MRDFSWLDLKEKQVLPDEVGIRLGVVLYVCCARYVCLFLAVVRGALLSEEGTTKMVPTVALVWAIGALVWAVVPLPNEVETL